MCCTWHKIHLQWEIKHTFTHPKNLEMAVVYLMTWFHCVLIYISFEWKTDFWRGVGRDVRYFICENFRGLKFTLFSSFPVSVKPLQSAMLWCTLLYTDIQQCMYYSSCMILWSLCHLYLSLSQKGRRSHLFLILLILFLVFSLILVYLGRMSFLSAVP